MELDIISKRYGTLPSDVAKLSNEDFMLTLLTASTGIEHEAKEQEKAIKKAKSQRTRR